MQHYGLTVAVTSVWSTVMLTAHHAVTPAVWCNKTDQVENFVRWPIVGGFSQTAAMWQINALASDPSACGPASAIVSSTNAPWHIVADKQLFAIIGYTVLDVMRGGQVFPVKPLTW